MLGNQLNPNSSMAKSMTETLNSELEAHSIYTAEPNLNTTQLVGPPLPNRSSVSVKVLILLVQIIKGFITVS